MNKPVSFELAKLLKEKAFDEEVRGRYCIKKITPFEVGLFYLSDYELIENFIYGPTIAEVVMWLYEKHGIWIYTGHSDYNMSFRTWIQTLNIKGSDIIEVPLIKICKSPTEAYEAAIEYSLKNIV